LDLIDLESIVEVTCSTITKTRRKNYIILRT